MPSSRIPKMVAPGGLCSFLLVSCAAIGAVPGALAGALDRTVAAAVVPDFGEPVLCRSSQAMARRDTTASPEPARPKGHPVRHHWHRGDAACWSGDREFCDRIAVAVPVATPMLASVALPSCLSTDPSAVLFGSGFEPGEGQSGTGAVVQLWSDPATWGGTLPQAGQSVLIPPGRIVVLDTNTPVLGSLTVEGTLTVAQNLDLTLSASVIMVHGGRFRVGCAEDPYLRSLTITLVGPPSSANPHGMGSKVLGAMAGGSIDIHGRPVRSWTRLAENAPAGAATIRVVDAAGWRVGDRIVVASGSFEPNEAEVRTVTAMSGNLLTLDQPLATARLGVLRTIDGRALDMRTEVGLLSRNIVIQGDPESTTTRFGGHIMIMEGGAARIDGVQLRRLGQFDRIGRYPVHYHLLGATSNQFVSNSSVDGSIQRGIVVHGTRHVSVADNVVFDTVGHGVVIEDPDAIHNAILRNLVLKNRIAFFTDPELRAQGDDQASNFWIKAARNQFVGNVAAGAEANGFWFDFTTDSPTDFRQNQAHSAAGRADHVPFNRQSGLLVEDAIEVDHPVPALEFVDTLLHRNNAGLWPATHGYGAPPQVHRRLILADHTRGFPLVGEAVGNAILLEDPLFVGDSSAPAPAGFVLNPVHLQYGATIELRRPTFANWGNLHLVSATDIFAPWQADFTIEGARFVNTAASSAVVDENTVVDLRDDTYGPRGIYVPADQPSLAGPGAVPAMIGEVPLLKYQTPVGHAFFKLAVGTNEVASNGTYLVRSDGLRFRETGSPGWRMAYGAGFSYRFETAPSTAAEYRLRLDLFGGRRRADVGPARTVVTLPVSRAPLALFRLPWGEYGPDPPGPSNALAAAASIQEFEANPLTRYLYDAAAQTLRFTADERWVVVRP